MSGVADACPPAAVCAAYEVRGDSEPQLVLRLLNFFAQRNMLPDSVRVRRQGEEVLVSIELGGISDREAMIIAGKMRSLVLVRSVELEYRLTRAA